MNNTLLISGEYAKDFNSLVQDYSVDETKTEPFAFVGSNLNFFFLNCL